MIGESDVSVSAASMWKVSSVSNQALQVGGTGAWKYVVFGLQRGATTATNLITYF
jgi:hypothetical protein